MSIASCLRDLNRPRPVDADPRTPPPPASIPERDGGEPSWAGTEPDGPGMVPDGGLDAYARGLVAPVKRRPNSVPACVIEDELAADARWEARQDRHDAWLDDREAE